MEWIISGYCRHQDQNRTVLLEREDGAFQWDCAFPGCSFAPNCTIAQRLQRIQNEEDTL